MKIRKSKLSPETEAQKFPKRRVMNIDETSGLIEQNCM